jgi:hypothetical protein
MERSSNWKDILAAMVFLSTFLGVSYGVYSFMQGASFLKSLALGYPIAFAACALFVAACAGIEALKKLRSESKRIVVHTYVHR